MAKAVEMSNGNEFKMGDPYYCTDCERNHTKGKIYKEHLSFAQSSIIEDEEVDAIDRDYDEKEELLDAAIEMGLDLEDEYEEMEDEYEEMELIEEEEPEVMKLIEEVGSVESFEDCIKAVKKLPGVGEATLNKLIKAGFNSLEAIAYTPPSIIKDESGLGDKTTAKLVKASMDLLGIGFKGGDEIWEVRKNIARITTGSQELDDLLGGGVETGGIIEFFGEFRTGKTQVMHQLCVNVQLPRDMGGLGGKALYIDTEGTFRPERIIQMSEFLNLDYNQVLKNIIYGRAYNSDHQMLLIKEAANIIKAKNIKLIIVDSLIGHFRSEYVGRGTLANRQQLINTHLHDLMRLCDIHKELIVCVTNQVSSKPDVFYGNPTTHTGGHIVAHGSTIRVFLRKGKGEQRVAKIIDAPHLPEGEAIFSITEDGIKGE